MSAVRLEVLGGAGTVCRFEGLGAWFAPGTPRELATMVADAARRACADGAPALGLAHAVQGAVGRSEHRPVSFAVARLTAPTAAVVVTGSVVVADEEVERLGSHAAEGLLEADLDFERLLTVRGSTDPDALHHAGCLPFDLRQGVVPGGGFVLHAPTELRTGSGAEAPHKLGVPASVVLFDLSNPALSADRGPLPVSESQRGSGSPRHATPPDAAGAPAGDGLAEVTDVPSDKGVEDAAPPAAEPVRPDLVPGIRCARGHFNHPDALYCRQCGIAMVQRSAILENGPRPSLGVLILDDGSTFSLDDDYVIGRSPQTTEEVRGGTARALPVDDGTGQISRAHAKVSLDGWNVVVTDLGSRNGTHVLNPGETTWRLLGKNDSVPLVAGGRLAIGQRKMEFQTLQRR